jgi:glutamate/tyrosine decarboxylase-like PLP-dependent enzyme
VNTGALDPFDQLADLCAREGLWFHVDGAFGAWAVLAPSVRARMRGMERADSLGFDLHKWGYLPLEIACVLVRRDPDQLDSFAATSTYHAVADGGIAARAKRFSDYGPQLSRGFRALKVWMGLKEQGVAKLGRLIQQNVDQAAYLAWRVRQHPELELLAPVPLNNVCFRFVGGRETSLDLDALNRRLLVRLHEDGIAAPSFTLLDGRYALRVAITNHRSRREDFDLLLNETLRLGRELAFARADAATPA